MTSAAEAALKTESLMARLKPCPYAKRIASIVCGRTSTCGLGKVGRMQARIEFGDAELTPEIAPTWGEGSDVYHVTEKCKRLQAVARVRRMTSRIPPSSLRLCFNCEDIMRAQRRG